jgi:hypothetical protein
VLLFDESFAFQRAMAVCGHHPRGEAVECGSIAIVATTEEAGTAMAILFNSVLREKDIDPASVLLLRHQDQRAARERTPYDLWCKNRPAFERYQSLQPFCSVRGDSLHLFGDMVDTFGSP